ncbi:MAG: hypothetical protein ACOYNN_06665 [Terrimicrobiaceae bacterium]|jgi:hypothetical protein
MRTLHVAFCSVVFLCGFSAVWATEPNVSISASAKLGDEVTFVDVVQEVVIKPSGTIFLNFGKEFPNEVLTVIVMDETRPRFPDVEKWSGKKVRVVGEVSEHDGHRRIILRERDQISLAE